MSHTKAKRHCQEWKKIEFQRESSLKDFTARLEFARQNLANNDLGESCDIAEQQLLLVKISDDVIYDVKIHYRLIEKNSEELIVITFKNDSSFSTKGIKYQVGFNNTKGRTINMASKFLVVGGASSRTKIDPGEFLSHFTCEEDDSVNVVANIVVYEDHEIRSSAIKDTFPSPDLSSMLAESVLCDVTLKCEDFERNCHRVVLALKSDVFKRMFKEEGFGRDGVIKITETDPVTLDAFINCIYKIDESLLKENAYEMLKLADRYNVKDLFTSCSNVLQNNLTVDIAPQCLLLGYLHNDKLLEEKSLRIVCENFPTIRQSEEWTELAKSHPELLSTIIDKLAKN